MSVLNAPTEIITLENLAIALVMPLLVILIIFLQRLKIGKLYLYALGRAALQLAIIGYILRFIFGLDSGLAVLAYLLLMVGIAAQIVLRQQRKASPAFYPILGLAILAGSVLSIVMVTQVVIKIKPWYNPRYLIPIAGMIIGNTMTASALALERLQNDIRQTRRKVETLISLGATRAQAARQSINRALKAGLMPNITSMLGVGLVHLPGMMTGQMIAGNDPAQAVRYQILVSFMLSAAVGVTVLITLHLSARRHFTPAHQLRNEMLE